MLKLKPGYTLPIVAIDTEYDELKRPFLATVVDQREQATVYRLEKFEEYTQFKAICENPHLRKIFHQLTADKTALLNIGVQVVPEYEDTMIIAALLVENFMKLGLKDLARLFLNEKTETQTKLKTIINKLKKKAKTEGRKFSWRDIPLDVIIPYAKDDPRYTIRLYFLWKKEIKKYQKTYDFEKELIPVIVDMQSNGIMIDRSFVKKQIQLYKNELSISYQHMNQILKSNKSACTDFNPRSPKQITEVLQRLGAPLQKTTAKGDLSTNAEVLQELAVQTKVKCLSGDRQTYLSVPKDVNKFVKHLLDYRFFSKHLSTYYDPLYTHYTSSSNNIGHFDFYQSGAKTGRFSAELFQTFPRPEESRRSGHVHEVRRCVCCPKDQLIVGIDCDQIEMRLFAHYSKSRRLIKAFEMGIDPYVQIAKDLFSQSLMETSKTMFKALRWLGKKIALGIIYGMGVFKTVWTMIYELPNIADSQTIKLIDLSETKARETLQKFYSLYPVKEHMRELTGQVYRTGELKLKIKSPLMDIQRIYSVHHKLAYKAINIEIQGTAAYYLKAAMIRVYKKLKQKIIDATTMIGTVHDELLFYTQQDQKSEARVRKLMQTMEDRVTFRVPITVSAKVSSHSWGEMKEWDRKERFKNLLRHEYQNAA